MKYCPNCGERIVKENNVQTINKTKTTTKADKDTVSFGWAVLCFFIPDVGLILFLV